MAAACRNHACSMAVQIESKRQRRNQSCFGSVYFFVCLLNSFERVPVPTVTQKPYGSNESNVGMPMLRSEFSTDVPSTAVQGTNALHVSISARAAALPPKMYSLRARRGVQVANNPARGAGAQTAVPVSTFSECVYTQEQPIVRRRILSETSYSAFISLTNP